MKRIGVFLFLFTVVLCALYGYSFTMFEKKQNQLEQAKKIEQLKLSEQVEEKTESATESVDAKVYHWEYKMILEQEEINVYKYGEENVFFSVPINQSRLNDESIQQLKKGICVIDEASLYAQLESFSS